jgi:anti-sigma factor RsiW
MIGDLDRNRTLAAFPGRALAKRSEHVRMNPTSPRATSLISSVLFAALAAGSCGDSSKPGSAHPSGVVLADTRLVVTNAFYFKADWLIPFNPDRQRESMNRADS